MAIELACIPQPIEMEPAGMMRPAKETDDVVGADLEAAAGFLTNLSFFIVSITVLVGSVWVAFSRRLTPA